MPITIDQKVNILNFGAWLNQCNSVQRGVFSKTADSVTLTSTGEDCYTITYADSGMSIPVQPGDVCEMTWDAEGEGTPRIIMFAGADHYETAESDTSPFVFTVPAGYNYIKIRFGIRESGKTIKFSNVKIHTMRTNTYYWEQAPGSYPKLIGESPLIDLPVDPYPYSMMVQQEGEYPKYAHLNPIDSPVDPYPYSMMVQQEGEYPKYAHLNPLDIGAFIMATNLEKITIPESVKEIGEHTFQHTGLKEVNIASDCIYHPTSFPDDCIITFY